jgi:hypothetical protein
VIVGNLATYPPRREALLAVVARLAPQFDRLNVVLNEHDAEIEALRAHATVRQIVPATDHKDIGKFLPDTSGARDVFLLDDDILYPDDYVQRTLERRDSLGLERVAVGYHASVYFRPRFGLSKARRTLWLRSWRRRNVIDCRTTLKFDKAQERARRVSQLGTGSACLRAADMPPLSFMQGARQFADVRLARWLWRSGIPMVSLPREAGWMTAIEHERTIYRDFTRANPREVAEEVWTYAYNPLPGLREEAGGGAA